MKRRVLSAGLLIVAATAVTVAADDRADYNRRAADTDMAAFKQLDLNHDGRLTENEARPDLNLYPRFRDIDIDRNGVITLEEMRGYIERTYGVRPSS